MPTFNSDGSMNVGCYAPEYGVFSAVSRPQKVHLGSWSSSHLLDDFPFVAESPNYAFAIMSAGLYQFGNLGGYPNIGSLMPLAEAKSRLCASLRRKPNLELWNYSFTKGYSPTLYDFSVLFNSTSIAAFSLPAAFAIWTTGQYVSDGGPSSTTGRFIYAAEFSDTQKFESFSDYYDVFGVLSPGGGAIGNNYLFAFLYGLASCVALLVQENRGKTLDSISSNSDFVKVMNQLVSIGAIDNPSVSSNRISLRRGGLVNAQQLNSDLYDTLQLASQVNPYGSLSPSLLDGQIRSAFYGLVDVFRMKSLFDMGGMTFNYHKA